MEESLLEHPKSSSFSGDTSPAASVADDSLPRCTIDVTNMDGFSLKNLEPQVRGRCKVRGRSSDGGFGGFGGGFGIWAALGCLRAPAAPASDDEDEGSEQYEGKEWMMTAATLASNSCR